MTKSRKVKLKASTIKKRVMNDDYAFHVWLQNATIVNPVRKSFYDVLNLRDDNALFDVRVIISSECKSTIISFR